jgi:hypothetical protein
MFEKEAEEWWNNEYFPSLYDNVSEVWKEGAEFGYNKANEWHHVKDGITPTHSYRVLVYTDEGVGFGIYGLDDKKWHTYDTGFDVIAWKEIVLPKESE